MLLKIFLTDLSISLKIIISIPIMYAKKITRSGFPTEKNPAKVIFH